jgi:hypothetical protein
MDNAYQGYEMIYDIVILTTAIDRPELHSKVFDRYKNYIGEVKCKWIITVNNITDRVSETEEQLRFLLQDYDLQIQTFTTGGSRIDWYNSVKYCINQANTIVPKFGYLWLEDDWMCDTGHLKDDIKLVSEENCHISLANRNEVSFNPGLWDIYSFNHLMFHSINNPEDSLGMRYVDGINTNPERICCPFPEATKFVKSFKSVNRFYDIGREWQQQTINTRTFNIN